MTGNMGSLYNLFTANFGGMLLGLIGIVTIYAGVDAFAPGYSMPLATLTLFSIVLIFLSKRVH